MTHFTFIAASYGVSILGLGLLTLWLVLDYRGTKKVLEELEARRKSRRRQAAERTLATRADALEKSV
ncbi:heme exporter protein CcmD [Xanthobacter sp. TB0136]|uniref:heme exporter protein CcmD n=1 Tax=Xanthobacter sp. TB0136 TaxID=3459177 RepID=UPI004039E647